MSNGGDIVTDTPDFVWLLDKWNTDGRYPLDYVRQQYGFGHREELTEATTPVEPAAVESPWEKMRTGRMAAKLVPREPNTEMIHTITTDDTVTDTTFVKPLDDDEGWDEADYNKAAGPARAWLNEHAGRDGASDPQTAEGN